MSHKAHQWAMRQRGIPSSARHLLIWLAEHHNEKTGRCDPSVALLCDETGMSADTVRRMLKALSEAGLIRRTYRDAATTLIELDLSRELNGEADTASRPPQNQRPETPAKSAAHPRKTRNGGSQNQRDPLAKSGTNQGIEPGKEPGKGTTPLSPPEGATQKPLAIPPVASPRQPIPPWMPVDAWAAWCAYRAKAKRDRWTPEAERRAILVLGRLMDDGNDPAAVIDQSIAAGWTGLFALKGPGRGGRYQPGGRFDDVRADYESDPDRPFADIEARERAYSGDPGPQPRVVINQRGEPI